jgi:hypothetical protein
MQISLILSHPGIELIFYPPIERLFSFDRTFSRKITSAHIHVGKKNSEIKKGNFVEKTRTEERSWGLRKKRASAEVGAWMRENGARGSLPRVWST